MKGIVCLDDAGGMMFNRRRQSRDRILLEDVREMTAGARLWVSPYSEKLLTEHGLCVCADADLLERAGENDWVFLEDRGIAPFAERVDTLVIYRWNRLYPGDLFWDTDPKRAGLHLAEQKEFAGSSHETITKEIWKR